MSQTTETITVPQPAKPERRAAIVGTAQTWKQTPWTDPNLDIYGLNDLYMLGHRITGQYALPRCAGWYDLHPFNHMSFRPLNQTRVSHMEVPTGAYLRPEGHLDWLKAQTVPVYVNQKPAGWPAHVQEFPRAALEAKYGTYFSSTPAWMLVHLMELGYTTIEIYGIHLATEWEYISQRPNLEHWIGVAIARGVKIILPERCPLLKSKHVYAYEPKHDLPLQHAQLTIQQIKHDGAVLQQQLAATKFFDLGRKRDLQARITVVNLELADAKQAFGRAQAVVHAS